MPESVSIDGKRTLRDSQDYATLRTLGIEHIQSLSGALWTDHNLHDPGITTLEILCYALTDLGYRTDFDMEDLLTKPDGTIDPPETSGLFPAHEILPCSPLTIDDYRRLLLKIEGIRNAWLDPMTDPEQADNYRRSEAPFFADCHAGHLSPHATNALNESNERVRITGLYDVLLELESDDDADRQRCIDTARCVLDAHRNLCEDFLDIRAVDTEPFAICADVEVETDADLEDVQARIFHAIEKYLNPPIRYYELQEMLDDGLAADEIFNGPFIDFGFRCDDAVVFTKPGFIRQEDLESSGLRRFIYVSDIINLLMDEPGVVSVRNVQLNRLDEDGRRVGDSEKWCMEVTPAHQPLLAIDRSKILLFKDEIPYHAQATELEDALERLRAMDRKAAYTEPQQVLDPPAGRYREPDRFFSIQHDFPRTYAIGKARLPANAPAERVAQARQLKAYLMFFDQLLADYLAQLANVRRLLSLDTTLGQTYFPPYLTDIAGVRGDFEDEFYADRAEFEDDTQRLRLIEDEDLYHERRNRLLDHLLARFAESFTDYALMMFDLEGNPLLTGDRLIEDKIEFLRSYPVVSRERHKACNVRPEDPSRIWNTTNVSGLETRVSRLLGIPDFERRDLACDGLFDILFDTRQVGNDVRVEIKTAGQVIIFKSQEVFPTADDALDEARTLLPRLRDPSSYRIDTSGGTGAVFFAIDAGGVSLRHDELFDTEADAVQAIRRLIDRYDQILVESESCNNEGFHLIEHILLRPRINGDELMHVCLDDDCALCGEEDPYSFRISVILPYWPARFQDLNFRRFLERTVREETPAHIHARICWIDNQQMTELDRVHRAWLEALSRAADAPDVLTEASRELVLLLGRLKTVYPAALLHDCTDGEDENPVRLGSTNLGIF